MSIKPRYSLLTLMILIMLIAGGLKLWRGPHHVVELDETNIEHEYWFVRDWQGDEVVDGPYIQRFLDEQGSVLRVDISFYREGRILPFLYCINVLIGDMAPKQDLSRNLTQSPLSATETIVFTQTLEHESQRLQKGGSRIEQGYLNSVELK